MVKPDKGLNDPKTQKQLLILGAMVFLLLIVGAYFAFVVFFSGNTTSETPNSNVQSKPIHIKKKHTPKTTTLSSVNPKMIETPNTNISEQNSDKDTPLKDKKKIIKEEDSKAKTNEVISKDISKNQKQETSPSDKDKLLKDILDAAQNDSINSDSTNSTVQNLDLLDQMPDKKIYKDSVFQKGSLKYIVVSTENLNNMILNAKKQMGRIDPFNNTDKGDVNKTIKDINKMVSDMFKGNKGNQNIKPPVGIKKLSDIIPPPPDLKTIKPEYKAGLNLTPNYSFVNPAQTLLEKTQVTGIFGNAAVLNFSGVSRALQTGQNYKGIVVLSVSSNSVVLKASGVKVTKYLRD